jgi:Short C-terminal domain
VGRFGAVRRPLPLGHPGGGETHTRDLPQARPHYEPPAAGAPAPDPIAQLEQLWELHLQGVLTDEEFAAQKAKVLG